MHTDRVKLVAMDMDGTLLNSKGEVSREFFELFEKLKHRIHFVAASGRQYHSIHHKLESIADQLTIIAENGGLARRGQQDLLFTGLPATHLPGIIRSLRNTQETEIILCGKDSAYLESKDEEFIHTMEEFYKEYRLVDDLHRVDPTNILKVAAYHREDSERNIYPAVTYLESELLVKVSGKHWVDISHPLANKGRALKMVQESMGISEEETMVFGDYNNDLEMLECAYFSYAMENAHPNVKARARFATGSNDELGVEQVLRQLI